MESYKSNNSQKGNCLTQYKNREWRICCLNLLWSIWLIYICVLNRLNDGGRKGIEVNEIENDLNNYECSHHVTNCTYGIHWISPFLLLFFISIFYIFILLYLLDILWSTWYNFRKWFLIMTNIFKFIHLPFRSLFWFTNLTLWSIFGIFLWMTWNLNFPIGFWIRWALLLFLSFHILYFYYIM